jgi:hypothetical protein
LTAKYKPALSYNKRLSRTHPTPYAFKPLQPSTASPIYVSC